MLEHAPQSEELIYYCGRCKLELNHRVTLKSGGAPQRVLCLTCHTERTYRSAKPTNSKPRAERQPKVVVSSKSNPHHWEDKIQDSRIHSTPYKITESFENDTVLLHPSFGRGVIIEQLPPDKIKVYFNSEIKILKCGKTL